MHEVELIGLDGSNLLAYLTALGALRVLSNNSADVRMSWREKNVWTPVVRSGFHSAEELLSVLRPLVCGAETLNEACRIGENLKFSKESFAKLLGEAARESTPQDRLKADFLCAFGSDAFGTGKEQQIQDTEFRTMSGAGHQNFLEFMKQLSENTDSLHLRRALFAEWDYADDKPSLRWDPADYRPHAFRAKDPSTDPIRTMRGANRLAIESLPLFPTAPSAKALRTTGFNNRDGAKEITWPIWSEPIDINTVRSLLALNQLQTVDAFVLRRRGVSQAFRSVRFTDRKFRNFTPGRPLL